jgi:predicted RNA-binding protein YlxR (DUF448 family)
VECRTTQPKRDLVRVVRLAEGGVAVDETGKKSGRGAYLCRSRECWYSALGRGRLEHALKTSLTVEEKEALRGYADGLREATVSKAMQNDTSHATEQGGC